MIKHEFDENGYCIYCKFTKIELEKVKVLDLGCGTNKHAGAIGLDIVQLKDVDLVFDLNDTPYSFASEQFDLIWANDILEHLNDPIAIMKECYRLLKKGGKLRIKVVYWSHRFTHADPQHKWSFEVERYFKVFTGEIRSYYLDFHFKDLKIDWIFDMAAIQKWIGQKRREDLTRSEEIRLLGKGYWHTNVIQGANIELTKPEENTNEK